MATQGINGRGPAGEDFLNREGHPLASTENTSNTPADSGTGVNVALLRGINVGGKNKLPMKDLATMFMDAGCSDVRTYIQSGNVLYRAEPALEEDIPSLIGASILDRFGLQIPVVTRNGQELEDIVRRNPFAEHSGEPDKLHVAFLSDLPDPVNVESLDPYHSPPDQFALLGREVYLYCPNGMARTKLSNSYFDSRLAATSTMRNWKTVLKLLDLATGAG